MVGLSGALSMEIQGQAVFARWTKEKQQVFEQTDLGPSRVLELNFTCLNLPQKAKLICQISLSLKHWVSELRPVLICNPQKCKIIHLPEHLWLFCGTSRHQYTHCGSSWRFQMTTSQLYEFLDILFCEGPVPGFRSLFLVDHLFCSWLLGILYPERALYMFWTRGLLTCSTVFCSLPLYALNW